jgi:hypothetical protein
MGETIRSLLSGGDRRSIGRVSEVLKLVQDRPKKVSTVVSCLFDLDPSVTMRAADLLEKLSRQRAELLQPLKAKLLNLAAETTQKELRWHLALILPRLQLTRAECESTAKLLETYLDDRSAIVKTFALQGLADLTSQLPALLPWVIETIRLQAKTGTAAMRARGRHLLRTLETDKA